MPRSVYVEEDDDEELTIRYPERRPIISAYEAEQRPGRRGTTKPYNYGRQPRTPVRRRIYDDDAFDGRPERERRLPVGQGIVGNAPLASGKGIFGTGQAISSTISKDMTRGQGARNAALLGEFGKKSTKSMGTWTRDRPGAKPPVVVRGPQADVSSRVIDTDVLYPEVKYAPNSRERTRPQYYREPPPRVTNSYEMNSLSPRYPEDEGSQDYLVRGERARVVPQQSPRREGPVSYSGISRGPVIGAQREIVTDRSPPPVIVIDRSQRRRAPVEY